MVKLRLVRPEKKHEKQVMAYLEEFYADGSELHGIGGLNRYAGDYDGWLRHVEEMRHLEPSASLVPAETFFLMKQADDAAQEPECLVGMVNIRFTLNDALWNYGGHIGYSIRPCERRQGYNKVNLYLALRVCQKHGLEAVLLDCKKENLGSAKTMRALGGRLIREYVAQTTAESGVTMQQYVIDVNEAVAKYAEKYDPLVAEYPD